MRTSRYAGDNIFCPHEVVAPKELDKGSFLVKIIIPAKIKSIIMEQLAQKGITTEYLFPQNDENEKNMRNEVLSCQAHCQQF